MVWLCASHYCFLISLGQSTESSQSQIHKGEEIHALIKCVCVHVCMKLNNYCEGHVIIIVCVCVCVLSYLTMIVVHEMHVLMHHNYCQVTINKLFVSLSAMTPFHHQPTL